MKRKTKRKGAERKPAPVGNRQLLLRLPENVGTKLDKAAENSGTTAQAVVLGILAGHYGIEVAAPRRGQPKKVEE